MNQASAGLEWRSGEPLGDAVLVTVEQLIAELRRAGVPIGLTETTDALEALRQVTVFDREVCKHALAATLIKRESHAALFDELFEIYFSLRGGPWQMEAPGSADVEGNLADLHNRLGRPNIPDELSPAARALSDALRAALRSGDENLMKRLAQASVDAYAGMEPGRAIGGSYYLYRTLRRMGFDAALSELLAAAQDASEATMTDLERRLLSEEYRRHAEAIRSEIEAEVRRRLVTHRGADSVARSARHPLPEQIEFMHANGQDLVTLRKAMVPLGRKLASRLALRRRHRRKGHLDFRRTVRRSLATGGVPMEPRFRSARPAKPDLFVIADISGSVAAFARFTLQLVYAISAQFAHVRCFAFVDGIDEVTDYLRDATDVGEAIHRINTEADVIWMDGHSDYGHALESFWRRWGAEVTPRTTVLLLGDARNNYHAHNAWVVQELSRKARRVHWLNPEPSTYWDTGDSILASYAGFCTGVWECRNLSQLESFVEHLE